MWVYNSFIANRTAYSKPGRDKNFSFYPDGDLCSVKILKNLRFFGECDTRHDIPTDTTVYYAVHPKKSLPASFAHPILQEVQSVLTEEVWPWGEVDSI